MFVLKFNFWFFKVYVIKIIYDWLMMGEKRVDLIIMVLSFEVSGESVGGGEIRVFEGMFEGELDFGV